MTRNSIWIGALTIALVCGVAGTASLVGSGGLRLVQKGLAHGAAPQSCVAQQSSAVGLVVRLRPGYDIGALAMPGASVSRMEPTRKVPPPSLRGAVVLAATDGATRSALATRLGGDAAVDSVGVLLAQSANSAYRSCDYKLEDNPAAQALASVGIDAMVLSGYLSDADARDPAAILLSDDPTRSDSVVLTVAIRDAVSQARSDAVGSPSNVFGLRGIVAVIDVKTREVTDIGAAPWYGPK